jgi:hypothetical protein
MNAYYFAFTPTGCREIDVILSAIASAGKGYHHTEDWSTPMDAYPPFRGTSYLEFIYNAAIDAAKEIELLRAQKAELEKNCAIFSEEEEELERTTLELQATQNALREEIQRYLVDISGWQKRYAELEQKLNAQNPL